MLRCLTAWVAVLTACSGPDGGVASLPDRTGPGGEGGNEAGGWDSAEGVGSTASSCPETPHEPSVPIVGYADFPVFVEGTERRFVTIQSAILGADEGDVVVVCPGTYAENIDFEGKVLRLTSHAGPDKTVIDGVGTLSTVSFRNEEPPEAVLEGFTIQGGDETEHCGGGVFVDRASPTIRHNVVTENRAGIGGGVCVRGGGATVHNNLIVGNEARDQGGGISCSGCFGAFRYNTVVGNVSREGHVGSYSAGSADFIGNVLVAGEGESGYALRVTDWHEDSEPMISHNLLWPDGFDWAGGTAGNRWDEASEAMLRADPLFVESTEADYRLSATSPARNAGPPHETDSDGSRADLGAFGGPDGDWPWD